MGSSPVKMVSIVGSGNGGTIGGGSCNGSGCVINGRRLLLTSGFVFFLGCFVLYGFVAGVYAWFVFRPHYGRLGMNSIGCGEDNEGSWSIGVFYGDSPFSLKPIENMNVWRDESSAWPVANPILTCATASDSSRGSDFVANPFLYIKGDTFYLFYETKNSITKQGDIGVAESVDKGATWKVLGIALDEDWHLSYPYVFSHYDDIYMLPESSTKGDLRLYRAVNFPLEWKLEKIILEKPFVDTTIIVIDGTFWLFGSDHSGFGTHRNGQLEIWYSDSPLGPWKPHKKNPIYNNIDPSFGARNGGRPFMYNGDLYRVGQDSGETYGRRVRTFKVEVLTTDVYKEVEVPFTVEEVHKGLNSWNGARNHHLDVQQLSSGEWFAVMDGDRVVAGDLHSRFVLGCASMAAVAAIVVLLGVLLGTVNCIIPLNWCGHYSGKRSDVFLAWERANLFSSNVRWICSRVNRVPSFLRGWMKANTLVGRMVLGFTFLTGAILMCIGVRYIFGGSGAEEAYLWKGHNSQFTLVTMTYDARMWNLKMYVKHYSRCSSVKEIVVIWNKGIPPELSDLDSAVPVRIRVESKNSLNNRFKIDPLIKTRAVLELDDDIMMFCDDVEKGFNVWRQHPDRIVGFYPRLVDENMKYNGEKYARSRKGYNMILTGAAFMDIRLAFERYWGEEAKPGREIVDKFFNCEDVLLNFLYGNASSSRRTVDYVRPAWAFDTSKFSGAAISRNTQVHYQKRSDCLEIFSEIYGSLSDRKWEFDGRKDGLDL